MPSSPVTVAADVYGRQHDAQSLLVDAPAGAYYDAFSQATEGGIVTGTDAVHLAGRFGTNDFCSRASRSRRCSTASRQGAGMITLQGGMAAREFADFESVSSYALEAMDWAVNTVCSRATTIASCRRTTAPVPRS